MKNYTGRERIKSVLNGKNSQQTTVFHRGYTPNNKILKERLGVDHIDQFVDIGGIYKLQIIRGMGINWA